MFDEKEVIYAVADDLEEALNKAKEIVGKEDATVVAIPDGVAVMVTK